MYHHMKLQHLKPQTNHKTWHTDDKATMVINIMTKTRYFCTLALLDARTTLIITLLAREGGKVSDWEMNVHYVFSSIQGIFANMVYEYNVANM